jgi:endonuclease/exonuclease/phosphatase (EEP) superfamily protein YafD
LLKIPLSRRFTIVTLSILGLLSPWLAQLFNQYNRIFWVLDLVVHLQWLFALGLFVTVLLLINKDKRYAALLVFLAMPFLSSSPILPTGKSAKTLTIASANVHVSTTNVAQLREWLTTQNPQVVIVLEVSNALSKELPNLKEYPYQVIEADDSPFGIALLSKLPIIKSAAISNIEDIPHLEADLNFDGKPISIYAFHPMPPLSPHYHQSRDEQLFALATKINNRQLPAIIAGDFNATPWSSAFRSLSTLNLKRVNLAPTWPNWGYKIIGIPIDHIVASDQWRLSDSQVGKAIGSDHFPVIVKLSLIEKDSP